MARILVVDDAAFMRTMVKDMLSKIGHQVVGEVKNGHEAVELYNALKPDLVTMDITMPEKDGLEALKEILALDSSAKVIMCSAMGQESMVIQAVQLGAKDFCVKPIQENRLKEAVEKVIS